MQWKDGCGDVNADEEEFWWTSSSSTASWFRKASDVERSGAFQAPTLSAWRSRDLQRKDGFGDVGADEEESWWINSSLQVEFSLSFSHSLGLCPLPLSPSPPPLSFLPLPSPSPSSIHQILFRQTFPANFYVMLGKLFQRVYPSAVWLIVKLSFTLHVWIYFVTLWTLHWESALC